MHPEHPPLGAASWLLSGPLPERVRWLHRNGFSGLALLQSVMATPAAEREEAAALIREFGMALTYHANFHHRLLQPPRPDRDFLARMADDILWWHENAEGVLCACSDTVHAERPDGKKSFLEDVQLEAFAFLSERLSPAGIAVGVENAFGPGASFASIASFRDFLDAAPHPKPGMLLDLGHANVHVRSDGTPGESDIASYISAIPFEILEIHVSDNLGRRDDHKGTGFGNLDLEAALAAALARGRPLQITVEVCVDMASGRYAADISNPEQTAPILTTAAALKRALASRPPLHH